jgi:hypothetical protein
MAITVNASDKALDPTLTLASPNAEHNTVDFAIGFTMDIP